jgi:hypothetical protein
MNTNDLLVAILAETKKQTATLGFGPPPKPRYIYANRQYPDALWYFWDGGNNKHDPISHHAITGLIEKLEIETKEFRGKPDPKVNLHIRCGVQRYILQAGYDTQFAKGLLHSLSIVPKRAFANPITIAVEAGETEQVLFCRIYNPETGSSIYAPYDKEPDWASVAAKVMQSLSGTEVSAPSPPVEADPTTTAVRTINGDQIKRLFAIARKAGFADGALKILIGEYQYISTKDISISDYEAICASAADPQLAVAYNAKHQPALPKLPVGTW